MHAPAGVAPSWNRAGGGVVVRTTSDIVAHAGRASMEDDVFWRTAEGDQPAFVEELRRRARRGD